MPSLFRESAVTPPMEQDRRSPSSEGNDTDGFVSINSMHRGKLSEWLSESHLDIWSSISGTAISGEDDIGSVPSQEEAPLPEIQPIDLDHNNFLERYRHENKWFELKNKPIPSTRPELDEWVEEWANAYDEGFRLEIPRFFSDGSRMAILDLMAAFKLQDAETYENSFLKEYTVSVEESDILEEFSWDHILGRITEFWPEVKKNARLDGEKNDKADSDVRIKQATHIEQNQIYFHWIALKDSDIPSTKRDLKAWLDRWTTIYHRAVDVNFPYFIEDESINPKTDFIRCSDRDDKPEWVSFFNTCWWDLYSDPPKYSFDAMLARFQREWLQKKEAKAEEKLKCICGLKNHQKWSECYYLNELIRPEGWIPKSKSMARIDEQAQNDKKLKKFIQNHRKKKLPPPPPKQEEPKKEEEEEEDQGPFHALFPIFKEQDRADHEKFKTTFFLPNNTPVHICNDRSRFTTFKQRDPTLPQNKIHCMDIFNTTLGIHGVGEVILKATAPDGTENARTLMLGDVKYCPKAPCNAVSTSRLITKGVLFDGRTDMLCVMKDGEQMDVAKVEFLYNRAILVVE